MIVFTDAFTVGADVDPASYPATPNYSYCLGAVNNAVINAANDRFQPVTTAIDIVCRLLAASGAPTGDQQITATAQNQNNGDTGYIALRCAAATQDCYVLQLSTHQPNEVELYRVTTGAFTLIASADRGIGTGAASYTLRGKATGTATVNLEFQVNATATVTFADSAADRKQSGRPGVGAFQHLAAPLPWVDDVSVDDLLASAVGRRATFQPLAPRVRLYQPSMQVRRAGIGGQALNNYVLNADAGAYVLSGSAAQLRAARLLNAAAGTYVLTGAAAKTLAGRVLLAAPGTYTLSGAAAKLTAARLLNAAPGTYVLSGAAAKLLAGRLLSANAGVYTLSGVAAKLLAGRVLLGSPGVYVLNGAAAQLIYTPLGPTNYVLNADPGSYALVGKAILATANRLLTAAAGVYALTGAPAQLTQGVPGPVAPIAEAPAGPTWTTHKETTRQGRKRRRDRQARLQVRGRRRFKDPVLELLETVPPPTAPPPAPPAPVPARPIPPAPEWQFTVQPAPPPPVWTPPGRVALDPALEIAFQLPPRELAWDDGVDEDLLDVLAAL